MPSAHGVQVVLFWVGSIFLVLGVGAAVILFVNMVSWSRRPHAAVNPAGIQAAGATASAEALKAIAEILKEVADLIRALSAAPVWLALTFTGVALILLGRWAV